MRRPKRENSERTDPASPTANREKILATALRLFAAQGVGGTPTARISREAGVSTGTLFHYFPEKNRLVVQLYLGIKQEIGEALRSDDDPALPVRERFERCLRTYIAWGLAHPEEVRFLDQFDYLPDVGDELKEREAYEDLAWMLELVRMAVREGVLPDLPPAFLGPMIVRVLNGILAAIAAGETGMSEDEIVEAGLAMLRKA